MNGNPCFILTRGFQTKKEKFCKSLCFWSGSDAVLHMSRIEFNNLSSCEVQRLNQFRTANLITDWLSCFSHLAQPGITAVDRL